MGTPTLLETFPDRRRICLMLRADGWSYDEIAVFLGIEIRTVRHELEQASGQMADVLDHRGPRPSGRLAQLIYVIGFIDGGGDPQDLPDQLGSLVERAKWLRSRMQANARPTAGLPPS